MNWKLFLIIITNAANINVADIPGMLGLDALKPKEQIDVFYAIDADGVSIGKLDDKIILMSEELVFKFYDTTPSAFEKRICDSFPLSEIAVLTLDEGINLYGYNIIKNGIRQRVKSGEDLQLYVDYGDKLQEEIAISQEKLFEPKELKEIKAGNSKEDVQKIIDREIGNRTTYRLTARYFNTQFDETGSDFEKLILTRFE